MTYFTDASRKMLEDLEKSWDKLGVPKQVEVMPKIAGYQMKDTKVDGDTARVAVAPTYIREGKEVTEDVIIGLKREKGAWKIFEFGKPGEEIVNFEEQGRENEARLKALEE